MFREQWRGDPALWGARQRPLKAARFRHHARLQEQPDQCQQTLVDDPPPDLINDEAVWKLIETRLDVRLHDPLIRVDRELVNLGDRVLAAAAGPVGVARRVEVRFEDRLHDELESHLHHPAWVSTVPEPEAAGMTPTAVPPEVR